MFNKFKSVFLSLACLVLFVLPLIATAQEKFFGEAETATEMIRNIYWFGIGIVGFAAMVVIVIAGIMYMQSYGDPQKITQAKQLIGGALIGVVILLFSYTILRTVNPALVRLREPLMEVKVCGIEGDSCDAENPCCSGFDCIGGKCVSSPLEKYSASMCKQWQYEPTGRCVDELKDGETVSWSDPKAHVSGMIVFKEPIDHPSQRKVKMEAILRCPSESECPGRTCSYAHHSTYDGMFPYCRGATGVKDKTIYINTLGRYAVGSIWCVRIGKPVNLTKNFDIPSGSKCPRPITLRIYDTASPKRFADIKEDLTIYLKKP